MNVIDIKKRLSDKTRPVFAIGVAADLVGVSVHTLRMYETEGLIIPQRTKSKRRLYSQKDIERLQCIRVMIEDRGFNLAGIKGMMSMAPCWEIKGCSEEDRATCDAYKSSLEPCWMVKSKTSACQDETCSECPVYRDVTTCHNMKSYLQEHWKNT
ncbi:MAG: MerR family transcriptional regulator [Candidatus Marinimicrobia bacterium]|jgi:MerR family transcriptional regulator, heat shock protein HspR|nr:MerR family transcriptional regulator [Candidatus Neomarinimicrobiota bacterium]MBT4360268.1 MerR family transcriptional regulator [Candidatus Neomarinimicrobiota bacterium]MBT4715706.1 MerR family transcriptional regulator [Candidatus Neomarinimicrobiota bacterium]MBT4947882.1 MerR family transcriptional regulator [Candidatus Neomarinimicrobiota bacterium]MBT5267979.1 MerR family transcriptional regulator [Candidatus Neomarinimicrobiota bacterium]